MRELSLMQQRLNTACPYFTMFPLSFPLEVLREAAPTDRVLDPFCGRGTTLFAARTLGLHSVGIDASPVAAAIAGSKVAEATVEEVLAELDACLASQPGSVPEGEFWQWGYAASTLADICVLREALAVRDNPAATVLRAIVLGVLHGPLRVGPATYLSNQMPRTYATKPSGAVRFWQKRNQPAPEVDVRDVVERRVRFVLADVPGRGDGQVHLGDAGAVLAGIDDEFEWVVTSPPYYGMRTYVPDQWLRQWFVGGPPTVTYADPDQLSHSGIDEFTADLARVWDAVAERLAPGGRLVVRFGAVPSSGRTDSEGILRTALSTGQAKWEILRVVEAGEPPSSSRQANQMRTPGDYIREIDLVAVLDG